VATIFLIRAGSGAWPGRLKKMCCTEPTRANRERMHVGLRGHPPQVLLGPQIGGEYRLHLAKRPVRRERLLRTPLAQPASSVIARLVKPTVPSTAMIFSVAAKSSVHVLRLVTCLTNGAARYVQLRGTLQVKVNGLRMIKGNRERAAELRGAILPGVRAEARVWRPTLVVTAGTAALK